MTSTKKDSVSNEFCEIPGVALCACAISSSGSIDRIKRALGDSVAQISKIQIENKYVTENYKGSL